ncbi:Hypothetical predicted protein [Mytilus galloprovincialis]|uniref:Ig-like domain-containing protein n=1 Tax=Mytilus galloprovincialis TaxID=29158 RepID=A0A8B6E1M3_MYTGA|nr:Hypothetical predicted protein [Mytilus galloprovincialis]
MELNILGIITFELLMTVSAIHIPTSVIEPSVDEVYVTEGDTATLVCSVTWPGRLIVIWTRVSDGNPLTIGTLVYTYDERISIQHSRKNDWNLLIRNVKLYDAGKYVCQVNGKGIFATGTVLLKVNVSAIPIPTPAFKPSAEEVYVTEGDTATLVCSVKWPGRLFVIWIRNFGVQLLTVEESVVIPDSRISIQHATGANDWNLVIKDVKPDDAGKYVCEVYGYSIRKMVLLQVNAVNESIHFIKTPSDVWVKKGQFARFECAATGRSTPTISWSKDDADDFPAAQERRMHKMSDSDEFFIMDVTVNDAGVYTCTATNADGSISTDVNLFVSCKYYLY